MALLQVLQLGAQIVEFLLRKRLGESNDLCFHAVSKEESLLGSLQILAADGDLKGGSEPASRGIDKCGMWRILLRAGHSGSHRQQKKNTPRTPDHARAPMISRSIPAVLMLSSLLAPTKTGWPKGWGRLA